MNNLILFDTNVEMCVAWHSYFEDVPVQIINDDFRNVSANAIVSPANSFGFMDGGIDLAYSEYFGWQVQEAVQNKISLYNEVPELFVGQAISVDTGNAKVPRLICAPTMRVPMGIHDPADVYLATRAALYLAKREGWSVMMPGMGTGAGAVNVNVAARRMRQAYDEVMEGKPRRFSSWSEAREYHMGRYR